MLIKTLYRIHSLELRKAIAESKLMLYVVFITCCVGLPNAEVYTSLDHRNGYFLCESS
jgi:hypothetical protein